MKYIVHLTIANANEKLIAEIREQAKSAFDPKYYIVVVTNEMVLIKVHPRWIYRIMTWFNSLIHRPKSLELKTEI